MKEQIRYEDQLTDSQPVAPIVELFHMVQSLIPKGQQVTTIPPYTMVTDAIKLMQDYRFSQLPVVSGKAVLGVFSYRSLTKGLTELGLIDTDFRELPVDEFMEPIPYVQPINKWESILDHLDQEDVVLLGNRDDLQGILTSMDVLIFLHRLASPFLMLAEIELSLRRIIEDCVSEEELKNCGMNSLRGKYQAQEMPASTSDMTFNDYVQIIGDGRNWPFFEPAFGKGNWLRKKTVARLTEVRYLRNDTFHFSRQLEDADYETLREHRDWLEMKSRSFEGRLKKQDVDPEPTPAKKTQGKINRTAFLATCDPAVVDFFSWLLDEAKAHNFIIAWGTTGFSVRVKLPGNMASFAYGYPPDSFQAYLDSKLGLAVAEEAAWRQELLAYGFFTEGGEFTLKAQVTPGNSARIRESFTLLINKVKALTRYPLPIQATVQGKVITAELLDEQGRVHFNGKEYKSPSGAGKDASGWKSTNGWKFWQYYEDVSEEWRPIDDLRKK